MENKVEITGTVKSIKKYTNEKGTLLTAWFDQRDASRFSDGTIDKISYVVGMNIIALDEAVIAGIEEGKMLTLTGRLVTRFDRRDIPREQQNKPYVQLEVHSVA